MPSPISRCLLSLLAALAVGVGGVSSFAAATTDAARLAFFEQRGFSLSAFVPNNVGHFPWLIEIDAIVVSNTLMSLANIG